MTDRINALVVILEKDVRTDDVESAVNAIRMIKGVLDVKKNVADIADAVAYGRAKSLLLKKMVEAVHEEEK